MVIELGPVLLSINTEELLNITPQCCIPRVANHSGTTDLYVTIATQPNLGYLQHNIHIYIYTDIILYIYIYIIYIL